ncbi:MAG: NYN domain-containing protein, partial [Acidimicrobiia bacterium]
MEEERIAVFVDFENLAIGAREALGAHEFDFEPIANALAERGRVVSRRAYADWSMFSDARQAMTRRHVELIEIPQRMGATRKNTA